MAVIIAFLGLFPLLALVIYSASGCYEEEIENYHEWKEQRTLLKNEEEKGKLSLTDGEGGELSIHD